MVYAGIDVHRKRSQVALVDAEGKELVNRNVDNASEAMLGTLDDLEPGTPVAFEVAYGWGWLADLLEDHELEAHLVHPRPRGRARRRRVRGRGQPADGGEPRRG